MSSFLAKLLRPDRRDKSKDIQNLGKRQYAPPPDWLDEYDVMTISEKQERLEMNQRRHKQKVRRRSNSANKMPNTKTKKSTNQTKRHSSAFSSLLCMSGNVDTLERTPMPENSLETQSNSSTKNKEFKNVADFMRNRSKKSNKNARRRYSAPAPDWTVVQNFSDLEDADKEILAQVTPGQRQPRELSPTVRYRVDGTLERPYVFPGGLTFGPEGRKTPLRRTSPEYAGGSRRRRHSSEYTVHADVHSESKENIILEYGSDPDGGRDPNGSDFDVRQAFYLKYDSSVRYSMPAISDPCGTDNDAQMDGVPYVSNEVRPQRSIPRRNQSDGSDRFDGDGIRNSKRGRPRKRYSMPPKNDACVYMGSFENINISHLCSEEDSQARRSRRDKKRNRYSLPPKNSEFVYMGSFENVSQAKGNQTLTPVLTKPRKLNYDDSSYELDPQNAVLSNVDTSGRQGVGDTDVRDYDAGRCDAQPSAEGNRADAIFDVPDGSESRASLTRAGYRHSLPELNLPTRLSVAKLNKSDGHSDVEYEDEKDDFFDDDFSKSFNSRTSNPFSRNLGRSSCNPGNKRLTIAPPPCVFPTDVNTDKNKQCIKNSEQLSSSWENRQFYIPPPPDYTPPKEVMESVQGQLSNWACHKGSQTDLSVDCDSVNMEDRDTSLKRADARTVMAEISSAQQAETPMRSESQRRVQMLKAKFDHLNNLSAQNYQPERKMANVSNVSQGSDDVFMDNNHSFAPSATIKADSSSVARNITAQCGNFQHDIDTVDTPPVSFSNFLPSSDCQKAETISQYRPATTETSTQMYSENLYDNNVSPQAVTSTPKVNRRPNRTKSANSGRPVPVPRKRYSLIGLDRNCSEKFQVKETAMASPPRSKPTPPVPMKRKTVSHKNSSITQANKGDSQVNQRTEQNIENADQILYDTVPEHDAEEDARTLNRSQIKCEYSTPYDANLYEEIDSSAVGSHNCSANFDNEEYEHIYATCDEVWSARFENGQNSSSGGQHVDDILPGLKEMKLASSPRPERRVKDRPVSSVEGLSLGQRQYYFGLSSSMADLTDMFHGKTILPPSDDNAPGQGNSEHEDDSDEDSIADDEMSISNDDHYEDMMKKRSLRKCVSADDLLKGGSILDRSLILARKRRLRMRERKCKSHMFSSTETDDGVIIHPDWSYKSPKHQDRGQPTKKSTKVQHSHDTHKPSHTDSGHDSDVISPCTSPDPRKRFDDMTTLNDVLDSNDRRQGTLTKKPWEIRLSQMQKIRRCRSRENMFASTSRLEKFSKTKIETIV